MSVNIPPDIETLSQVDAWARQNIVAYRQAYEFEELYSSLQKETCRILSESLMHRKPETEQLDIRAQRLGTLIVKIAICEQHVAANDIADDAADHYHANRAAYYELARQEDEHR